MVFQNDWFLAELLKFLDVSGTIRIASCCRALRVVKLVGGPEVVVRSLLPDADGHSLNDYGHGHRKPSEVHPWLEITCRSEPIRRCTPAAQ